MSTKKISATSEPAQEKTEAVLPLIAFTGNTLKTFATEVISELNKSPLTKTVVAGMLTPNLSPTVERVNKYLKENYEASYAKIISKSRKSGYSAKPSKVSFDTISGYETIKLNLMPAINFCTHLDEYRAADLKMARGYLFEGSLTDARDMAHALAGEITKKLHAAGSSKQWLTYEIHGASLVNKKLDKVLEECLEFGPTVLVITNIDWIYRQKDVEPEVYADIINRLSKYLSPESNLPIVVCATTENHTVLDPVLLEAKRFQLISLN
jgi:ATP-dependent Zn protease